MTIEMIEYTAAAISLLTILSTIPVLTKASNFFCERNARITIRIEHATSMEKKTDSKEINRVWAMVNNG